VLGWGPADFWASNVWEVASAFDAWAAANGVKKPFDESQYPTKEEREELHRKLKDKHGHA
jgi:hypothetical protein